MTLRGISLAFIFIFQLMYLPKYASYPPQNMMTVFLVSAIAFFSLYLLGGSVWHRIKSYKRGEYRLLYFFFTFFSVSLSMLVIYYSIEYVLPIDLRGVHPHLVIASGLFALMFFSWGYERGG